MVNSWLLNRLHVKVFIFGLLLLGGSVFAQNAPECLPLDSVYLNGQLPVSGTLDAIAAYFEQSPDTILIRDGDASASFMAFLQLGRVRYRLLLDGSVQLNVIQLDESLRSVDFFGRSFNQKTVPGDLESLFPLAYAQREGVQLEGQPATVLRVFASCDPTDEQLLFFFVRDQLYQISFFNAND